MSDYDVVVVGSGFGGSVAALRLAEKGYRVAVLEAGRRFADDEFPETSWDVRNFLWAPALGCHGIQRMSLLRNVLVLSGAGVGGGSLVYANTLYRPPDKFYRDPQWGDLTDWKDELSRWYGQAERMLGVPPYGPTTRADEAVKRGAARVGGAHEAAHVHRRPCGARRRGTGYPAAAARHEGARSAAAPVRQARRAHPDQLRGGPRRPRPAPRRGLHRRRGHHQLVPPGRGHARRAGAVRAGVGRDGAAADGARRWGHLAAAE